MMKNVVDFIQLKVTLRIFEESKLDGSLDKIGINCPILLEIFKILFENSTFFQRNLLPYGRKKIHPQNVCIISLKNRGKLLLYSCEVLLNSFSNVEIRILIKMSLSNLIFQRNKSFFVFTSSKQKIKNVRKKIVV